jgi:hypothetical protein
MKVAFTIGIDAAGKPSIISGIDVPRFEQRKAFKLMKADKLAGKWNAVVFADDPYVLRAKPKTTPEPLAEKQKQKAAK